MSTDAKNLAVAGVVGAVAGALVTGLVGVAGIFGRDKAAVSATITLTQTDAGCVARTLPATLIVGKKDVVQWTAVGNCTGFDLNRVEVRFVGTCQADGSKVASTVPDFFDEPAPHRGRKIKRNVKHGTDGCWSYEVWYLPASGSEVKLEDPELELMQF